MTDIMSLLEDGNTGIVLQVTGRDLLNFANAIMDRACESEKQRAAEAGTKKYLTKKEVMALLGVCDATLWHWNRNRYLCPIKVGRKVFYDRKAVMSIMSNKEL